ncbi:hypothetical protein [Paenibacillus sinopodophylli]|uniref:hypothetical protein n=1 Tax=Paenibacillus sinopodophylli TaxID=1837342 RepID=UPI00110CDCA0|nr:hypothetical protein [Paenibacillus sinopodophylli]
MAIVEQSESSYSTDDFVKRAYSWCSGDYSEEKSIAEMKEIYDEINSQSIKLSSYRVDGIATAEDGAVMIKVTRHWEDKSEDQTSYSIINLDGQWKIDDRF